MKRKNLLITTSILILGIFIFILFSNRALNSNLESVIQDDKRNEGFVGSLHYEYLVNYNSLVFSLDDVSYDYTIADVFRVFLQVADEMKDKDFTRFTFSYKGNKKFYIDGKYFKTLGKEYSIQNPLYTMRVFPSYLYKMDKTKAYSSLGGLISDYVDFTDFHENWYYDDMQNE